MKNFLSVIAMLLIGNLIVSGQQVAPKPIPFSEINLNTDQNLNQYLAKNVEQVRTIVWSSNMNNSSNWTVANAPNATLSTQWQWAQDTTSVSTNFKKYVGSSYFMNAPTNNQGVFYFDGITNLINHNYGKENSTLTNSTPISTLGYNGVTLKFYQLYKSYNQDSAIVEISNDNINWHKILVNPEITNGFANNYAYGFKEFNITPWAGNKAQVWIRFRFVAPATHPNGNLYSGGYGWMIDDVSIVEAPNNLLSFYEIRGGYVSSSSPNTWSGYTQFPSGQSFAVTMGGLFTNIGGAAQTNVHLKVKNITTGAERISSSAIDTMLVNQVDSLIVYNVDTLSNVGTYKYNLSAYTDSISSVYYKDTISITVNDQTHGQYSRDNDYYNGYRRWNVVTGSNVNAYQMANLVEVTTDEPIFAKSISFVVGSGTTVGAPVKAILYRGWGQNKTVIAESDYHYIQFKEIATTIGYNPPAIELFFTDYSNVKLEKDSAYFVAVQAYGGADTVWMAVGSSKTPQPDYTMYIFDTDNIWYYYPKGSSPAMIRLNTTNTSPLAVNEINPTKASLFQNMPNPATNSTRISYELKIKENVTIEIYDFLGHKIKSFNEGNKQAGFYFIDINLNEIAGGTYFYSLKTDKNTTTKKMVIVK